MTFGAVITFVLLLNIAPLLGAALYSCRCTYGEQCWPNASQFSQLASHLSQPLIYPVPFASPCYPISRPSGDCITVKDNQNNGTFRSDQPGTTQFPNFERYTSNVTIHACYMNTTLGFPCEQGSVPAIGVDARSASDIQVAVKFAARHNLRLVIKNTGHDYLGRSTARGSFMIWTHRMKRITYNPSFVAKGAPASEKYNTITVEAGVQWHEAYETAHVHGRTIVGGLAAGGSVGAAGGWFQGGGYGLISPYHGLGVDNAVQITVVISTGEHLTVNSHSHPYLFWALRGGGGGTFGVVTSVTYRTHPNSPLIAAFFTAHTTNPNTTKKLVTEFIRITPNLSDAGWGGHGLLTSPNTLELSYLAYNISSAQANASIDPFFSFAQTLAGSDGLVIERAFTASYDSYYDWYMPIYGTDGDDGASTEIGSRLLPRDVVEDYEAVADAFIYGQVTWILAGGAISKVDPDSMGLNPAWRNALVHAVVGTSWAEGTSASGVERVRNNLKQRLGKLTALAPDLGCYFNEASLYEPNPRDTFFGTHYDKLEAIKMVYDPIDLFLVAEGVGSDRWDRELKCRLVDEEETGSCSHE